jgi:hypothetical protein
VVEYLLYEYAQSAHIVQKITDMSLPRCRGEKHLKKFKLTRMEAICEYVAGVSLVFPMVRKNKERRLKTSARVVSSLLL